MLVLTFQPIHNFLPQKSVSESPFILPHYDQRDGKLKQEQRWLSNGSAIDRDRASGLGVKKLRGESFPIQGASLNPDTTNLNQPFSTFDPLGFDKIKYNPNNPNNPPNKIPRSK